MLANKFNDEKALVESYQKLEREFTKKCQELSRLKQDLENKESEVEEVLSDVPMEEEFIEVVLPEGVDTTPIETVETIKEESVETGKEEIAEPSRVEEVVASTQNEYFNLDFRAKAGEFMQKSPEAKPYAKEISKILLQDRSLLNCSDPFAVAFALALKNCKKTENEPAVEDTKAENELKQLPKVSVLSGGVIGLAPRENKKKFSSISDAGEEVLKRFF